VTIAVEVETTHIASGSFPRVYGRAEPAHLAPIDIPVAVGITEAPTKPHDVIAARETVAVAIERAAG
jgi:hypothetical protein